MQIVIFMYYNIIIPKCMSNLTFESLASSVRQLVENFPTAFPPDAITHVIEEEGLGKTPKIIINQTRISISNASITRWCKLDARIVIDSLTGRISGFINFIVANSLASVDDARSQYHCGSRNYATDYTSFAVQKEESPSAKLKVVLDGTQYPVGSNDKSDSNSVSEVDVVMAEINRGLDQFRDVLLEQQKNMTLEKLESRRLFVGIGSIPKQLRVTD